MAPRSSVLLIDQATDGKLSRLLKEHREEGMTFEAIARVLPSELGIEVVTTTVRNWCRELGIDTERQAS